MRTCSKRWGFVVAIVAIPLVLFLIASGPVPAHSVELKLVGYTNAPNNNSRFALFSVSNISGRSIRWWGDWVEVEGSSEKRAKVVNPALPGFTKDPVLKAHGTLTLAVGPPFHPPETGRWRFCMSFTRYSLPEKCLDFSFRHKLPLKLGPITLVDDQRILTSPNHLVVTSEWLVD